jgi:hypothetical protein
MSEAPPPIDAAPAAKAIEEGTRAFPRFAEMKPYLARIALFRGHTLQVKFHEDRRAQGDPDNFAFEKIVVKTYRALAGER